jgi:hypothetical protein
LRQYLTVKCPSEDNVRITARKRGHGRAVADADADDIFRPGDIERKKSVDVLFDRDPSRIHQDRALAGQPGHAMRVEQISVYSPAPVT